MSIEQQNNMDTCITDKKYVSCRLCPRNCSVDRTTMKKGYCGQSNKIRIARAALHYWEEPCISGEHGSGAIFFSGCQLKCIFCQNHDISMGTIGAEITEERLQQIMWELKEKGANNINLVTPTHFVPQIVCVLKRIKNEGFDLPIVYNTSSYETVETLRMLDGLIDIYLPDAKYDDCELARKFSKAPDYPEVAWLAIEEMVRQIKNAGGTAFDENHLMKRGVIIRHLILPGHTQDSKRIIKKLLDSYKDDVYISIMNQYTPLTMTQYTELNRKLTKREYERVVDYALNLGLNNGYFQEGETQMQSFIPDFNYEGVNNNTAF